MRRFMVLVAGLSMVLGSVVLLPASAGAGEVADADSLYELTRSSDFDQSDAELLRLYWAFFNRDPDLGGAKYWIGQAETTALADISWGFSNSAEFQQTYGATDDRQFLTIVYANVLGRDFDQEGFDYWLGQMQGGLARHEVVLWVARGQEFISAHPYPDPRDPVPEASTCSIDGRDPSLDWIEFSVGVTNNSGASGWAIVEVAMRIDGNRVGDDTAVADHVLPGERVIEHTFETDDIFDGVALDRIACDVTEVRWRAEESTPSGSCEIQGIAFGQTRNYRVSVTNPDAAVRDAWVETAFFVNGRRELLDLSIIDNVGALETVSDGAFASGNGIEGVAPPVLTCEIRHVEWRVPS